MDIKQLRTFLAVANARSFLGAAESMYVSRQAISKTVDQLESELKIKLFVRDQSGTMMTPAGIFFYPRASALVAAFDKLSDDMRDIESSYRPKLTICMALGIYGIYARKLFEYSEQHRAEMDIVIRSSLDSDCDTILADRQADATVSFTDKIGKTAESTVLLSSPVALLVNRLNPLSKCQRLEPDDIMHQKLLLYTGGRDHCLWWHTTPRPSDHVCSDLDYLFSLLQDDRGIMPLPQIMVPGYLDFAAALPCSVPLEPCSFYFSTLYPSYYDSLTYNLLATVQKDVFRTP